ncbi:methyl-accepting chemotaxis protein [Massilia sp. S19_KUP03_FR1]|uniref:methyl-accepting chemotaxis protein n=1 Tax=Massilia sp. S19_KUP03_FR1 TaxID=3025503 RepID=UPI002FCDC312
MPDIQPYSARQSTRHDAGFGDFFRYHGWLSPGIRLFRALSFQAKSAWISLAFLAPLVFALFYLWSAADGLIRVTTSERQGLTYSGLVVEGIKLAQLRRLAATTNQAALPDAQTQVRANVEALSAIEQQLGKSFNLEAAYRRASELQAQLQQSPVGATVAATFDAHTAYIDALLDLNNAVADGSQLSLDPDLDTYHMMNIAILRGPLLVEMVARIGNKGMLALLGHELAPQQRDSLMEDVAIQQQLVKEIAASYQQGLAADSDAAASLDIKGLIAAMKTQRDTLKSQVLGTELATQAPAYLAVSSAVLDGLLAGQARVAAELDRRLQARIERLSATIHFQLALALAFVLVACYLLLAFYKVMMGGLQEVAGHLQQITEGNLTTSPAPWGSDEAAQLMKTMGRMQTSLRDMVGIVIDSSASVQVASEEIAAASNDLSRRTEETAASLETTASSMEQIGSTVQHTAEAVKNAAAIVNDNARSASRGGAVMGQVVSTMNGIEQSSRKIEEIISVIDGIAFQTNILALNAAVEAARAGEQGRGFAVVASEVRILAQRSASAAKEIKVLIGDSMQQVQAGTTVAADAATTIAVIVSNAARIDKLMADVAASTAEQALGIAQVQLAMELLDTSTQQNAALVEQTAAASGTLSDQAQRLNEEISFFKLR